MLWAYQMIELIQKLFIDPYLQIEQIEREKHVINSFVWCQGRGLKLGNNIGQLGQQSLDL